MKITHRDLKPENIIVSDHRTVLLDYGLSKNKDWSMKTVCGTIEYMAPEVQQ